MEDHILFPLLHLMLVVCEWALAHWLFGSFSDFPTSNRIFFFSISVAQKAGLNFDTLLSVPMEHVGTFTFPPFQAAIDLSNMQSLQ